MASASPACLGSLQQEFAAIHVVAPEELEPAQFWVGETQFVDADSGAPKARHGNQAAHEKDPPSASRRLEFPKPLGDEIREMYSVRSDLPKSAAASCLHDSDQGAYFVKM
jgi:hypothetical protein